MPVPNEQFAFAAPMVGLFVVAMLLIALDVLRPTPAGKKPASSPSRPVEIPINRFARDRWSTSRILGKVQ